MNAESFCLCFFYFDVIHFSLCSMGVFVSVCLCDSVTPWHGSRISTLNAKKKKNKNQINQCVRCDLLCAVCTSIQNRMKFIAESGKSSNGWQTHELWIKNMKNDLFERKSFWRRVSIRWLVCTSDSSFLQQQQLVTKIISISFRTNKLQFHPKIHSWFTKFIKCSLFETDRILCCLDEKRLTAR